MAFYVYDSSGWKIVYEPGSDWREVQKSEENLPAPEKKPEGPFAKDKMVSSKEEEEETGYPYTPAREPQGLVASQIMRSPVMTLAPDATLEDALKMFKTYRFRHVPILSEERLVGILSDRHILNELQVKAGVKGGPSKQVSDIMITKVLTATPNTEVSEIAKTFIEQRIGAMPILDKKGKLCGMLTRSDILRTLVKVFPAELRI